MKTVEACPNTDNNIIYDKAGSYIKRGNLDYLIIYVENLHGNNNLIQINFLIKQALIYKWVSKLINKTTLLFEETIRGLHTMFVFDCKCIKYFRKNL